MYIKAKSEKRKRCREIRLYWSIALKSVGPSRRRIEASSLCPKVEGNEVETTHLCFPRPRASTDARSSRQARMIGEARWHYFRISNRTNQDRLLIPHETRTASASTGLESFFAGIRMSKSANNIKHFLKSTNE